MEHIIAQIHKLLVKKGKTVAIAESCTGGLLSGYLTQNSGSSQYFLLGLISYSNQSKIDILGVPAALIAKKGAVNTEVALKMAKEIRRMASADFGIGITGIAGPGGGTREKPVGTVFIAVTGKKNGVCRKFSFRGNRGAIRKESALKALLLLKKLMGK